MSAALAPEDLVRIEDEMKKIVGEDLEITPRGDQAGRCASGSFPKPARLYKVEMLEDMKDDTVSLYRQGEFFDLCRGPHVPAHVLSQGLQAPLHCRAPTGAAARRTRCSSASTASPFPDKKLLNSHIEFLEEAKRRDHRRLGKELDLFSIHDETGAGLVLWHPKGACLKNIIEDFWRKEHFKNGYDLVGTPHIGKSQLWETSGHLDFYTENMYSSMDIDGQPYYVKPMNCPFHIMIYKNKGWSYRELPLRWAELGTVYRYERAACSTACSGSAASPRTTRTSSAARTRCPTRSTASSPSASTCCARSGSRTSRSTWRPGPPRNRSATSRCGRRPSRPSRRRSTARASTTRSTRAAAPFTARRSTSR